MNIDFEISSVDCIVVLDRYVLGGNMLQEETYKHSFQEI